MKHFERARQVSLSNRTQIILHLGVFHVDKENEVGVIRIQKSVPICEHVLKVVEDMNKYQDMYNTVQKAEKKYETFTIYNF